MNHSARQLDNTAVAIAQSRLPPPILTYLGRNRWRLEQAYDYRHGDTRIRVPKDFQFDLASIPRALWWLIAPFELSIVAPLIHDFLYRFRGNPPPGSITPSRTYSRAEADELFETIMRQEEVPAWRRKAGFAAIRLFGGRRWGN